MNTEQINENIFTMIIMLSLSSYTTEILAMLRGRSVVFSVGQTWNSSILLLGFTNKFFLNTRLIMSLEHLNKISKLSFCLHRLRRW